MTTSIRTAAPTLEADVFVRGEGRCSVVAGVVSRDLGVVVALGACPLEVLELVVLEESFAADGAVVLAATLDDWHEVAARYGRRAGALPDPHRRSRFETCCVTLIVDPGGVVGHVGLRRTARETLEALEDLLVLPAIAA